MQLPRSPFQMQPLRNPFERVLPAVERFRNQVTDRVRLVGNNLTHRTQRSQTPPVDVRRVQDAARIAEVRSTIATATPQPSLRGVSEKSGVYPEQGRREAIPSQHSAKKAIIHGIAEATKNSAPAMAVGFGARYILGTTLGVQALAVAAGASALSRGVREFVYTKRKGTFAETTKLITRHEEATVLTNFDKTERRAHTGIRAKQDQFAQTSVGRVVNGMLHGGEKKIAEFAYGKRRHARALAKYSTLDSAGNVVFDTDRLRMDIAYSINPVKLLLKLRNDAIWARMTNGTACDVYEMRQLAKGAYSAVNTELRNKVIINKKDEKIVLDSAQAIHDAQLKLYKRQARVGAGINIVGQAGLAALKAVPKTIATFFITDAFLKAIHVDTSARHSPLEGFENTRLGHFIENAIAPKSVASAEEMSANAPKAVQLLPSTSPQGESPHNWTQGLMGSRPAPVAESADTTVTNKIVEAPKVISGSKVLSPEKITAVKPLAMPPTPSRVPVVVAMDDTNSRVVARAVVSGKEQVVKTVKTVTKVVQEQIATKKSLTQDIFDKKLIPSMESAPDAITWYGQAGTAKEMMEHIIMPNSTQLTPEHMNQLQEYLNTHPDASFGALWQANRNVFSADMDKWSIGAGYNVLTEHVMTQQEAQQVAIAEAKNAKVELADHEGRGKVPGHAKEVARSTVNSTLHQTDGPGVVLTPTQSVGTDTTHYQVVRPPQGAGASSVIRTSQGTYQQVAPPGGRSTINNTVNGFQQVRKPGDVISHGGTTNSQIGSPPQNGAVPPPHHGSSPDVGRSVSNSVNGYQQVAPPRGADTIHNSSNGSFQQIGQPTAPRPTVAIRSGNEAYQIVSPPKPQEQVSFQVVQQPRAVVHFDVPNENSAIGPIDLRYAQNHDVLLSSDSTFFPQASTMPITQLVDKAPAIGKGSYEYNVLGGLNIWSHTSSFKAGGEQWLEEARRYLQGGNGEPRLGPVQELYRAQQMMATAPHLFMNFDNQNTVGGTLSGVHHLALNSDGSLDLTTTGGVIGGGPETVSFIGCSYGHVQAIQMILDHASEAPSDLNQWFAILNDQNATGAAVENAVEQIVRGWFKGTEYYSGFYQLYGYLQEEIPSIGTPEYSKFLNDLANNGYMSSGRLEFEFTSGGQ